MRITLRQKNSERGVAIFIVLISVMVLASMAGIFAYNMRVETKLAMNSNNEHEMEWLGRSGVEYARWVLGLELSTPGPGQHFDALNQKWAGGTGETNDALAGIPMTGIKLGNGTIDIHIFDGERKININSAANNQALMTQALTLVGADASEIPTIIASVQDWIDPDEETHVSGAESDYYMALDPPYRSKNGPIDDLSELLLIKGITSDIFWGPSATNHQPSMFQPQRKIGAGTQSGQPIVSVGMIELFTPVSNGRLNINTCSANALRAIGMDESTATHVISMRAGPDGVDGTEDDVPFQNVNEMIANSGLPSQFAQIFQNNLTTRSTTFDVMVDVTIGQSTRRYHALIFRNDPRHIDVLSFNWE